MKLYNYFRSTASYRVRIALNIKHIGFENIDVHLRNFEQKHRDYLAVNPQGLVPTLNENGHIIHQSLAIIEYLEEICPTPPLLPQTPLARAKVRGLALLIACDIHPLNNLRVLEQLKTQFQASEEDINTWYHTWLKQGFDAFERHLEQNQHKGHTCFGHEVTLADLCLIPQVYNAERFGFSLAPYPLIRDVNAYCLGLPAFQNAAPD